MRPPAPPARPILKHLQRGQTVTPPLLHGRCPVQPTRPLKGRVREGSPDCDAAADGAVQDLGGALDPLGGSVEGVGNRGLRCLGAVDGGGAHVAQAGELLLRGAQPRTDVDQFVAHGQRRHHRQTRVADLAEFAAQGFDALLQALGELQEPDFLSFFAGHAVLPAVDGDVDMVHSSSSSPASSSSPLWPPSPTPRTSRMVSIATSSRSAISRLARSSLRDFTSDPSSSSASRERSAPSAWIRLASSSSSRSASRRRSTALSNASSAVISRRVAASISAVGGSAGGGKLAGRSFIEACAKAFPAAAAAAKKPALGQALIVRNLRGRGCQRNAAGELCTAKQVFVASKRWTPGTQVLSAP